MADEKYVPDYEQLPGRWYVLFFSEKTGNYSVSTGRERGFTSWQEATALAVSRNRMAIIRVQQDKPNRLRYFVINEADAEEFGMVIIEGRMLWPEEVRQMTTPESGGSG